MVPGVGGRGRIACIEKAVGIHIDEPGRAIAFGVIEVGIDAVEEELVVGAGEVGRAVRMVRRDSNPAWQSYTSSRPRQPWHVPRVDDCFARRNHGRTAGEAVRGNRGDWLGLNQLPSRRATVSDLTTVVVQMKESKIGQCGSLALHGPKRREASGWEQPRGRSVDLFDRNEEATVGVAIQFRRRTGGRRGNREGTVGIPLQYTARSCSVLVLDCHRMRS